MTAPDRLPRRTGRRLRPAAVLAAATVLTTLAAGCGVQSTGLHVVAAAPVTVNSPTTSATTERGKYQVRIFLVQSNTRALVPVTRFLQDPPTDMAILAELRKDPTPDEVDNGYENQVPADLDLEPTQKQARQYYYNGALDRPWTVTARLQVVCSLDVYWLLNPQSGLLPSTQLLVNGLNAKFDDCPDYAPYLASVPATGDPSAPWAGKYPPGVAVRPTTGPSDSRNP